MSIESILLFGSHHVFVYTFVVLDIADPIDVLVPFSTNQDATHSRHQFDVGQVWILHNLLVVVSTKPTEKESKEHRTIMAVNQVAVLVVLDVVTTFVGRLVIDSTRQRILLAHVEQSSKSQFH